jgi:hypothetical protein
MAPYCWGAADYVIPQGATPRTQQGPLELCVECMETYQERLKRSIVLVGEDCEWHQTLMVTQNIWDGAHDYRRNLMQDRCHHVGCEHKRQQEAQDTPQRREESA